MDRWWWLRMFCGISAAGEKGEQTVSELIREAVQEVQRPVFFARAIIITAYLPIFTLQHVEGRLFRPMALTVAFALLGALLFSLSILPVLAVMLFGPNTKEWENPILKLLIKGYRSSLEWSWAHCRAGYWLSE